MNHLPNPRRCVRSSILVLVLASSTTICADDSRVEGFTEPYRQIELAAGESGVLGKVAVQEGSRVSVGQTLAQLDTSVLEQTLEIARLRSRSVGGLKAAEAELELQSKYLGQLRTLREKGHATQRELDRAETDLKVAQARVVMAQEEIVLQQLECQRIEAQIERRRIRSPIDGLVSDVLRETGESSLGNDLHVVTVVQLDRLKIKFSVEAWQASLLQVDQTVPLQIGTQSDQVAGIVEMVSPVMDAKSATIEVTVRVENSDEKIPSGVRCWLVLSGAPPTDASTTSFTSSRADNAQ